MPQIIKIKKIFKLCNKVFSQIWQIEQISSFEESINNIFLKIDLLNLPNLREKTTHYKIAAAL